MKAELLERLLDAGFTKDEIISLARDLPEPKPTPEPIPEPTPEPEVEPTPEPAPEPEPEPVETETDKRLTLIETNLSKLLKAVQNSNLKKDSFGSVPESLEMETDKIMSSIIRPEQTEKKG